MSLLSALLKRLVIARTYPSLPWSQCTYTRDERTKPVFYYPLASRSQSLKFNVSHQAGLVVLLAANPDLQAADLQAGDVHDVEGHATDINADLGVDVVCPSERASRDHEMITKEGWANYVEIHDSVLSEDEAARLKAVQGPIDVKLGYFYTLWCLREAYVKMTGDALLATWLKDLDFRYFAPPGRPSIQQPGRHLEIWMGNEQDTNVAVALDWYLDNEFMIASTCRGSMQKHHLAQYQFLDLEAILAEAETRSQSG